MKKIIIITCLTLLLKPIIPVIEYAANYDYISKVLCVNKEKPQLHCNGKCHLMKELAKAAEKETPVSSDKKTSHSDSEILFFLPLPEFTFRLYNIINSQRVFYAVDLYYYLNDKTSGRPPTCMA
ncbi:hypothetical protein [Flavobacterium sp. 3HN19-14]|uniref:hypothetical protein n=1 Tax=Flavobacterium sp. 3HN19-14 TaxID=3448133 RepID=UPI003EDE8D08